MAGWLEQDFSTSPLLSSAAPSSSQRVRFPLIHAAFILHANLSHKSLHPRCTTESFARKILFQLKDPTYHSGLYEGVISRMGGELGNLPGSKNDSSCLTLNLGFWLLQMEPYSQAGSVHHGCARILPEAMATGPRGHVRTQLENPGAMNYPKISQNEGFQKPKV